MRIRAILLLFSVLCIGMAHADTIEVKGQITLLDGNMPPTVSLHSYTEDGMDITALVSKGGFTLRVPLYGATQYNLRFLRTSYDIMLSPKEKETSIAIILSHDQLNNIQLTKSSENEAYKAFGGIVNLYDGKLRKLFVGCEKEENCQKELNEILSDYKNDLEAISNKQKGTYTADILCKMKMPVVAKDVKNTLKEFRAGYFENVPYNDENILANPTYKEMIDAYVEFIVEPKYSKEEAFIKDLTGKAKANPKVYSKTAGMLYESLFSRSKEKMLEMFISWYNENKGAVNNPVVDLKVKNLSKGMPGGQFMNIVRNDQTGRQISLKDVADKSSCTLVLFWSSECSHCRDEMPLIKEMYEKYHAKGFNIYAVSLEQDQSKWSSYIHQNGLTWTNVRNMPEATDNPAIQYMVTATPTLILINKEGVIAHRFTPKNKLEKYIEEVLK